MTGEYHYAIVGGGIVGMATAQALGQQLPRARLVVLEKEQEIAVHQTGRNSGVIHSGIYYKPGSLKAAMARDGNRSMVEFCETHGIEHELCGKVIVATDAAELPALERLLDRGRLNGLTVERLASEQVAELEPAVRCVGGIRVPATGIVNYSQVCRTYARLIQERGGEIRTGVCVESCRLRNGHHEIVTSQGDVEARFLINCGGLQSDRVARCAGEKPMARIIPFRGEYYELVAEKRHLVKNLIYPVPNPDFPFLGVHFTRMIGGAVHAGPNAVLALKREGYSKSDVNLRDMAEIFGYAGFWRMAWKNLGEGAREMWRSFSKRAFVASLQRLIPAIEARDLVPCAAGVRAQALAPDGRLVDDFLILPGQQSLHVCNAPSPAATASLEIGRAIASQAARAAQ